MRIIHPTESRIFPWQVTRRATNCIDSLRSAHRNQLTNVNENPYRRWGILRRTSAHLRKSGNDVGSDLRVGSLDSRLKPRAIAIFLGSELPELGPSRSRNRCLVGCNLRIAPDTGRARMQGEATEASENLWHGFTAEFCPEERFGVASIVRDGSPSCRYGFYRGMLPVLGEFPLGRTPVR